MPPRKTAAPAVDSVRHRDRRVNIPTNELADFVADDDRAPRKALYPRDPSLDPQLVWKGKDEQDERDLEVASVPIYIQEKVMPSAIIEALRAQAKHETDDQLDLFGDFDDIAFEDLVDFYRHDQNWSNRMILGDSMRVMTSLAEREGLKGQVQMIYLDPPYGIKFGSNWQVSTRKRDVKDGKADDLTRQPEQVRAFRDTWELGIHSYLSYLRDRLMVARELLTETGSVFVQIGDENVHLVRCVMDEVFGSENWKSTITVQKTGGLGTASLRNVADYIVWYAKDAEKVKYRQLYRNKLVGEGHGSGARYDMLELAGGQRRRLTTEEASGSAGLPAGSRVFRLISLTSIGANPSTSFVHSFQGKDYCPPQNRCWSTNRKGLEKVDYVQRVVSTGTSLNYVYYLNDFPAYELHNVWTDIASPPDKVYVVQSHSRLMERCLLMTTDPGDLVLDPTCGSGTTAFVAEQWGRRWITIDTSRVALALARTRLMAGKYPYFLLSDSPEGAEKEAEITGQVPTIQKFDHDVRRGFVYRRVPHITLKAIANNPEIDTIHADFQQHLDPVLQRLNALLKQKWQEWEVPREPADKWPKEAVDLLARWWDLRRKRQEAIDASIARNADTELLYDQPYEDTKRVRVTGPFTVESLSPHRVLSTGEERPASERDGQRDCPAGQFETVVIENLRKAGVQNTKRGERLKFNYLEPCMGGTWIHAAGDYTDADGNVREVAVSIGPEHGTVGPEQVKDAAKEALKGKGYDVLIVCGFAFDAHAGEAAKEFSPLPSPNGGPPSGGAPKDGEAFAVKESRKLGRLTVLLARMNPDLAMADTLLKKTGAGNLFMVFGEPDLTIDRQKDGRIVVSLQGLDIYDPSTGEVRPSDTDDIACWFIDTDYNQESFFVRHAYFTGGDQPYEKLKRALRAEVDEAAWSSLYTTRSRPFDSPKSGRIAVKVINHYGDEVLRVYSLRETAGKR